MIIIGDKERNCTVLQFLQYVILHNTSAYSEVYSMLLVFYPEIEFKSWQRKKLNGSILEWNGQCW
jgi:hypothetical protein